MPFCQINLRTQLDITPHTNKKNSYLQLCVSLRCSFAQATGVWQQDTKRCSQFLRKNTNIPFWSSFTQDAWTRRSCIRVGSRELCCSLHSSWWWNIKDRDTVEASCRSTYIHDTGCHRRFWTCQTGYSWSWKSYHQYHYEYQLPLTVLSKNTWILKFKSQWMFVFFAAVNHHLLGNRCLREQV